ncbi:MAG TPA: peptidoglycan-binding domain-containing protein [Ktedonobacteraceae bacterium]
MAYFKRFLLLGSLSLTLLAGLMFTTSTWGSHSAFAAGCNATATGSWSNNCQTSEGNISLFTVAIQYVVTYSGTGCTTHGIDGDFGPNTFAGVECFQRAKHIGIDGIVGPQTWGTMENVLVCVGDFPNRPLQCHLPGNSSVLFIGANGGSGVWEVFFNGQNRTMVDNSLS